MRKSFSIRRAGRWAGVAVAAGVAATVLALPAAAAPATDPCTAVGSVVPCVDTGNGTSLNMRSGPSTGYRILGQVPDGAHVEITCQVHGQSINGLWGPTTLWDQISPISAGWHFVTDGYVYTGSNGLVAPICPGWS